VRKILDVRDKPCPEPVVLTKKALTLKDFKELEIITNSEISKENISRFLNTSGIKFEINRIENEYHILIKISDVDDKTVFSEKSSGLKLIISKNYFGEGDRKLGEILIKTFIHTLKESDKLIETIFFVNSGVFLTISDSPALEDLKDLECKGVEILSCGTCLDFYNIKDKIAVGKIGNMFRMLELIEKGGVVL
jgi:selenium metabolism protein YedF